MAAPMRPMTSAATAVCGLRAADVATQAPVCRSNSLTASVVVPTSTAAPYRPGIGRSASARTPVPVSICSSLRLSGSVTTASPSTVIWQERRVPARRSLSFGAETAPSTVTAHLPQLPRPPQGCAIYMPARCRRALSFSSPEKATRVFRPS